MARCRQQLPTSTQAATDAASSQCSVTVQLMADAGTEVSAGGPECCSACLGQDEAWLEQTTAPVNRCFEFDIQHRFP